MDALLGHSGIEGLTLKARITLKAIDNYDTVMFDEIPVNTFEHYIEQLSPTGEHFCEIRNYG